MITYMCCFIYIMNTGEEPYESSRQPYSRLSVTVILSQYKISVVVQLNRIYKINKLVLVHIMYMYVSNKQSQARFNAPSPNCPSIFHICI